MDFILGIDPGRHGAFVLINSAGQIVDRAFMEYSGPTLSAHATAKTYEKFLTLSKASSGRLTVFIEKAFTKPTDAVQEGYIEALEGCCREMVQRAGNLGNELVRANEAFLPVLGKIDEARRFAVAGGGRGRVDGRVGIFNYAKSAGILEVCAAYDIPYVLVHPKTWCAVMHKGADEKQKAKDKSRQIIERRWPEYARKGSLLWRERGKKMDEGLQDAFLIAQYGLQA